MKNKTRQTRQKERERQNKTKNYLVYGSKNSWNAEVHREPVKYNVCMALTIEIAYPKKGTR